MLAVEFPRAVRAHVAYVAVAAATFVLPTIVLGLLVYTRPELILSVVEPRNGRAVRGDVFAAAESIGRRARRHRLDDVRLLHPQQHRRRVPVLRRRPVRRRRQLFFLAYNGAFGGAHRRLSDRARPVVDVLFVRRHAFGVRADRDRRCRAPRACASATRCSRRAAARGAQALVDGRTRDRP